MYEPKLLTTARGSWGGLYIEMKRFLILLSILFPITLFAQRQRNYVYIFDCTGSMEVHKIWKPAKQFMKEDIDQLDENATVNIVLFHQHTADPIRFKAKDFNWNDVEVKCDSMFKKATHTGICHAWDLGLKYIDRNRNNYLYLFTDGLENVHPQRTEAVCQRIKDWCNQAPNNYAFFVALGEEMKKKPEVQKLIDATTSCDRAFFVDNNKHPAPFGAFDKTTFNVNCHSIRELSTGFSDYGTFDASIECQDEYYRVELKDGKIMDGKATFILKQKQQPSNNHQIKFKVNTDPENLNICNPIIYVNIDTRDLANLDMGQPSGVTEGQYDAGEAETYRSFLFWKGKKSDLIEVDLSAVFNGQAKKRNCSLMVFLDLPVEVKGKCSLFYNGERIDNSFVIKATDSRSVLGIEVPHELAQKEYVIGFKGQSNNLETINAEESRVYESSIYFEHEINWNPLQIILLWFGILALAFLLIWLLVLKPIIYPRFKSIRKGIYFKNCPPITINFKGARLVIIDNKSHKQSNWDRIFKGKIIYKQHPALLTRITMKPHRRGVMVVTDNSKYIITPNPMPRIGSAIVNDLTNRTNIEIK